MLQKHKPRLYIIMRKDISDMNPGKGMAQAAHAQADFDDQLIYGLTESDLIKNLYADWREDRTFGTTLVLSETLESMEYIGRNVEFAHMIVDPTYPFRNFYGELFVKPEITCMWVFPMDDEEVDFMQQFNLHS